LGVDWEPLVWVHNNAEKARVGVDKLGFVANLQIVEDRGVIQKGQIGHVFTFFKLWRVDLTNIGRFEDFFLERI
jgi:hypothetical protein